jgi:hypothetical protein
MFCPKLTVDVAGFLGFDPSIVLSDEYRYIQSSLFGRVPIDMVLFISNNLYGRGTVVRQVTLSKSQIVQALQHEQNLNKVAQRHGRYGVDRGERHLVGY